MAGSRRERGHGHLGVLVFKVQVKTLRSLWESLSNTVLVSANQTSLNQVLYHQPDYYYESAIRPD